MYKILENFHNDVIKCVKCGICQASCPTYMASSDECMVARGRMSLINSLLNGKTDITHGFKEKMSACTSCMGCVENCPADVQVVDIINAARSECYLSEKIGLLSKCINKIITKGWPLKYIAIYAGIPFTYLYRLLPPKYIGAIFPFFIRDNRKRTMPVFGGSSLKSLVPEVIKPYGKPKMRVLFFLGCMTDLVYQKSGYSVIEILKRNNIEVVIPKGLYCCGAPVYYIGDRDSACMIAEKNIEIINSFDVDSVITNCATCGSMLTHIYSLLSGSNGIKHHILDIHKFLVENRGSLEYDFDKNKNKARVTYHDPCHLKRGQKVSESPREILQSIPWIEFVEMEDADRCCGGAGIFSVKHYDLALEIARQKVKNIEATGADVVATGCPSCQMHLADALKREGLNIEVVHTVQLME